MKTNSIRYSVYPYNMEIHVLGFFFFFFTFGTISLIVPFFSLSFISFWNSCWFPVGFAGLASPFHLFVFPAVRGLASLVAVSQHCFPWLTEDGHRSFCLLHRLCCCLCGFAVLSVFVLCVEGCPQMPVGHEFLAHVGDPNAFL